MGLRSPVVRLIGCLAALYCCGCIVAGVFLAEMSLRIPRRPLTGRAKYRARMWREFHAPVQDSSIIAADGAVLRGWFVQPADSNRKAVLVLHGIGDNRLGAAGFGDYFLAHGYSVLLPDSREHGVSGGEVASYGILERDDLRRWIDWVRARAPGCTYVLGESMGAAIALQATAVAPKICAVAAESPYVTFREISYERLGWQTGLGSTFWRTIGRPVIEVAIWYAGARYDVNLPNAEPKAAVEMSHVPTLLIAGTADTNIPPSNAEELESACASHCSLWIVPGAGHGGASSIAPVEFWKRVPAWFENHGEPGRQ